ncbi:MAG: MATE family efflux transporter [Acetatifactor sp.]
MGESSAQKKSMGEVNLTRGNMFKNLIGFSLPYLLSSFLQTFYGLADLFISGQFNGADTITAVSVGSQITHMLTVVIAGLAMGTTVAIGRAVGAEKKDKIAEVLGNTLVMFALFAVVLTGLLVFLSESIVSAVSTPAEAVSQTKEYLLVCFMGVPFIVAYNVISSIFRGLGDSRTPMYFVAAAGVLNIILDYILIGFMHMGARGAAIATVTAQGCSVALAFWVMARGRMRVKLSPGNLRLKKETLGAVLKVGLPIACQDGFIQISFLVITAIANRRGVVVAAAVGIVEKLISFFFLVPSAMLSSVSAITAQNAGAGKHENGRSILRYGIGISVGFGLTVALVCQFCSGFLVGLFAKEETEVIRLGAQYLRSYIFDCAAAGIHFCFSGYFCAYGRAGLSFVHNVLSVLLIRIPGAYLASLWFPDTLYPMGWAPPAGSLLSAVICAVFFVVIRRRNGFGEYQGKKIRSKSK